MVIHSWQLTNTVLDNWNIRPWPLTVSLKFNSAMFWHLTIFIRHTQLKDSQSAIETLQNFNFATYCQRPNPMSSLIHAWPVCVICRHCPPRPNNDLNISQNQRCSIHSHRIKLTLIEHCWYNKTESQTYQWWSYWVQRLGPTCHHSIAVHNDLFHSCLAQARKTFCELCKHLHTQSHPGRRKSRAREKSNKSSIGWLKK